MCRSLVSFVQSGGELAAGSGFTHHIENFFHDRFLSDLVSIDARSESVMQGNRLDISQIRAILPGEQIE